jgi:hypothetical protein
MRVNIQTNIKQVTKHLNVIQKKQIPFAASNAINQTLFQTRKVMMKQTQQKLDRPIPFTVKGYLVTKAMKRNLTGILFVKGAVAKYLRFQIDGGIRKQDQRIGVPTDKAKLNQYGNIRGRKSGLIKKKTQFVQTINGTSGVWERTKKGTLQLIVAFNNSVQYESKFPFYKIGTKYIDSKFTSNFKKQMARALRSAK